MSEALRVQLVGFGTVGQGIAKALHGATAAGRRGIRIVSIVDRSGCVCQAKGVDLARALLVKGSTGRLADYGGDAVKPWSPLEAIANCEADVVVELTPTDVRTAEPATSHLHAAFRAGRHVVSANKGPLALHFQQVTRAAADAGVTLLYGASVCGAIPIIELGRDFLAGNEVSEVYGVFNGSCNCILSRMEEAGLSFDDALAEAHANGVTESDPSQDIDGWDAGAKLVILANSVLGQPLSLDDVAVSGIRGVTRRQIEEARGRGKRLRLIGRVSRTVARVSLEEVDERSPIVVPGTLNVAVVRTELAQEITLIGRGAGQMETASAVIADLNAVRRLHAGHAGGRTAGGHGPAACHVMRSPVLTVADSTPVTEVVAMMRRDAVSQVPVLRDGVAVGVVTEKSLIDHLAGGPSADLRRVTARDVMANPLPVVAETTPVRALAGVLARQPAVLVGAPDRIVGIVTKVDFIRSMER